MRQNQICLNAVNPQIPDSLSEDRLMFSSAGAQPISLKSFRGLGDFPNKIARVYKHEHCLLFCKEIPVVPRRISQVYIHLLCLLFSVSHVSKRHFPNGNRRQPPPCLPKSETDGRKSMAAQPFILTIDGVRPFCYKIRLPTSFCMQRLFHLGESSHAEGLHLPCLQLPHHPS